MKKIGTKDRRKTVLLKESSILEKDTVVDWKDRLKKWK